ncbi:lysylphosphatidylglycerol synthase domain-containing protein [Microvirga sp. 2MCAF38]|uniref:lysylphosphatidylglycerol synthase domain-containing protein n=1 Tax=Microvirga sp. 2MCAF38 TaxID=3232989 RepID=UPI003F94B13F
MNDVSPKPVPIEAEGEAGRAGARRRRFAWIGTIASILIFAASVLVLWHVVSDLDAEKLKSAFTAASGRQIGLAVLLTAVSYSLLTCYDALALKQLKLNVPYRTTALASFTSYAISFTLGFPLLTAGTVRYWIYGSRGVGPGRIASLTVIAGVTFWLGMALILAWSMVGSADDVANLVYYSNVHINQLIGVAAAGLVIAYLMWISLKKRIVRIQGWRLELPGFRLSAAQMLIGAGDVCAGAGVLFVLLPGGHNLSFETFLAVYIFAVMFGVASHAPGGLGVFEATILIALRQYPREPVLGALLLYRLCYYLVPFVVALAMLGAYEILNRIGSARKSLETDDIDPSCS